MKKKIGYWKWMSNGGTGFWKWIYDEMKPMVMFIAYSFIYWITIYILSEVIFDWYLTQGILFELLILPWIIPSIFIITYFMYKESNTVEERKEDGTESDVA